MFADSLIANRKSGLLKGGSSNGTDKRIELVAQHLPKSQMAEAFRALAHSTVIVPGGPSAPSHTGDECITAGG